MIEWLAIKAFFSKTWDVVKEYWQFFAGLAVAVLGMLAFRGRPDGTVVLENEKEANQKELEVIKESEEILKNKDMKMVTL